MAHRFLSLFLCLTALAAAQPEKLTRGVVAVRSSETEVFVSWRLLATDPANTAFHVYRYNGIDPAVLLTPTPLNGPTFLTDRDADLTRDNYYIVRPVVNNVELPDNPFAYLPAGAPIRQYLSIPLTPPPGGTTPDNVSFTYSANDASTGDLDGDGDYEIVLKWDPSNAKDNSQSGYTGNVFLDAYKLDGRHLWRIDLGRNIRAGAHYTQFLVYDLDGDGRAEIVCKTAPGTRDANGKPIADTNPDADHGNTAGYVLAGPEFFTIFDGATGAELITAPYEPPRGNVNAWGDNYGNRVDRFLAAVAYLDGERPSFLLCRGYYTRAVIAAYNWRGGQLTRLWVFDSEDGNPAYRGQGNHNLSVADVDNDGRDEIVYGAAAIDDNGQGLYTTGRGHGDAMHVADMDPARSGLEAFQVHETPAQYGRHGLDYKDARTGEPLCELGGTGDIGRGVAFDIDPRYPGFEFWGAGSVNGLFNVNCQQISTRRPGPMNFGVWWDGDLLRELLDNVTISKWDWDSSTVRTLFTSTEIASNNGTKATPALSADLFGDWREEVVWRTPDSSELRIYTTVIPTGHRITTLMHDRHYRLSIVWQNVAYNQPPHTGFYLGAPSP